MNSANIIEGGRVRRGAGGGKSYALVVDTEDEEMGGDGGEESDFEESD